LLLTAIKKGVESSSIPSALGLWPVHLFALLLGGSLLIKGRRFGLSLKSKLPMFLQKGTNK